MKKLYSFFLPVFFLLFTVPSNAFTNASSLNLLVPPPASTDYYTTMDGAMDSNIWSKTGHGGASCVCAPCVCAPCDIPANSNIYISHIVTLSCDLVLGSNVNLVVEAGGALIITGGGSVSGTGSFTVDAGGTVDISGDLTLSGTGDVILNGDINIGGDLIVTGAGSFCGSGSVSVTGVVVGVPDPCFTGFLPIELMYFSGNLINANADLYWATASETNNDYFTLLKSQNGIEWITLMQIEGAGTTNIANYYSRVDANPFSGTSYYKLRQTDYDGVFSESNIVVIHNDNLGEAEIIAYPNPVSGNEISLNVVGFTDEEINFTVTDVVGKTHYSSTFPLISASQIIQLQLGNKLSTGTYIVTGKTKSKTISKKILVK